MKPDIYKGIENEFDLNEERRLAAYFVNRFLNMGIGGSEESLLNTFGLPKELYDKFIRGAEEQESGNII